MEALQYTTIGGRTLNLGRLAAEERSFLELVLGEYEKRPGWTAFGAFWIREIQKTRLSPDSIVHRICDDLEARLGVAEGMVAPPDYRDYLADLIEERYGSRYRFCKEIGVDPGHLSRVLASRAELSLQALQEIMEALDAALVILPKESLSAHLSPEHASRALAAAVV